MEQRHFLVDQLNAPEVLPSTSGALQVGSDGSSGAPVGQRSDLDSSDVRMTLNARRTNFRQEERDALVTLVAEYMGLIESGYAARDGGSIHGRRHGDGLRSKAWAEIATRFNNNPNFLRRDVHQLRKCWMNMKTRSQFTSSQRRLLGMDLPTSSAASRSRTHGRRSKNKSVIRIRTPMSTGGSQGASRYHSLKQKTSFIRINKSSGSAWSRMRPRSNNSHIYRQSPMLSKSSRKPEAEGVFDLTREENYQEQSTSQGIMPLGDHGVRLQQDTMNDMSVDQSGTTRLTPPGLPVLQRSTAEIPQTSNSHIVAMLQTATPIAVQRSVRSPEQRLDCNVMLPPVESGTRGTLRSLPQQQQQQQQQQQRMIRNMNRTRPHNSQPAGSFVQLDNLKPQAQMSPSRRSNASTINVMKYASGETRGDAALKTYTIEDDGATSTRQFSAAEDNFNYQFDVSDGSRLSTLNTAASTLMLPQITPAVSSGELDINYRPKTSELGTLEADVPRINNVISETESKLLSSVDHPSSQTDQSDISEVQIVIKTEDDDTDLTLTDVQPVTTVALLEQPHSRESDHCTSNQGSSDTDFVDTLGHRASKLTSHGDKVKRVSHSPHGSGERQELQLHSFGNASDQRPHFFAGGGPGEKSKLHHAVRQQDEIRDDCRMSKNAEDAEGRLEDGSEMVDDQMDVSGAEHDDGFVERVAQKDSGSVGSFSRGVRDGRSDIIEEREKRAIRKDDGDPGVSDDWVDQKARRDILLFEVQKSKEEAAMARCRRELLEVEVETARQQMQLTRQRQEAEIELLREKIRQERAKADHLILQGASKGESEDLQAEQPNLPTALTESNDSNESDDTEKENT